MTSDDLGLAHADADPRWIGVRRHQAVLVLFGLGLIGDGVVRPRAPLVEVVLGVVLVASCTPLATGETVAEVAVIAARFALRRRWSVVEVSREGPSVRVGAHGLAIVRGYALTHVGRLDLSGRDLEVTESLGRFLDSLASAGEDRHVSVHVRTQRDGARTLLVVDGDATPPPEWTPDADLVARVVDVTAPPGWLYERWGYVRTHEGPRTVLRVRDFTAASAGRPALAAAQLVSDQATVSVHAGIVSGARGRRIAERAVHRLRSDGATGAAAGFRRTARVDRSLARLQSREAHVAAGRALIRLGVYVTVRAESLVELAPEARRVRSALHDAGVDTARGRGRQALWFCRSLPGGPGW